MARPDLIVVIALIAVPYAEEMTIPINALHQAVKGDPIILELVKRENKGGAKAIIYVKKNPEYVWSKLRDVKSFPEFMPDLKKVEVLKKEATYEVVKFTAEKMFEFSYVIERHYEPSDMVIWWKSADKRFEKMDGFWKIYPWKGGSVFLYFTWLKPKFFVPDFVVKYLTRHSLPGMLRAVKRRLEGSKDSHRKKRNIPF